MASDQDRRGATEAIGLLQSEGGTAIGEWLDAARQLFGRTQATARHAILLTDGRNESQDPTDLAADVEACRGVFQCDCRGVGTDWDVEELRRIATALLGSVDIVADPQGLAADFEAMISSSQSRAMPDVRLRVWAPQGAVIESLRQVSPEVVDLTATSSPSAPLARDFRLGGWAPGESRDYHLRIQVKPGAVGDEMLAGRVSLVLADDTVATQALVRAVWTDDVELSTRMEGHVAHYNGQVELADAIQSRAGRGQGRRRADGDRAARAGGRAGQGVRPRRHPATAGQGGRGRTRPSGTVKLRKGDREGGGDDPRHPLDPHRAPRRRKQP